MSWRMAENGLTRLGMKETNGVESVEELEVGVEGELADR